MNAPWTIVTDKAQAHLPEFSICNQIWICICFLHFIVCYCVFIGRFDYFIVIYISNGNEKHLFLKAVQAMFEINLG